MAPECSKKNTWLIAKASCFFSFYLCHSDTQRFLWLSEAPLIEARWKLVDAQLSVLILRLSYPLPGCWSFVGRNIFHPFNGRQQPVQSMVFEGTPVVY